MAIISQKIREALIAFDKDADGELLPAELVMAQLSLGVILNPSEQKTFDEKLPNGFIDYEKATAIIERVTAGKQPAQELEKLFRPFDTKKNGTVSSAEIKAVKKKSCKQIGVSFPSLLTSLSFHFLAHWSFHFLAH